MRPWQLKTKNSKVVVLYGLTRGGTNVLWNILQSHPAVCSAINETGELIALRRQGFRGAIKHALFSSPVARCSPLLAKVGRHVDDVFYHAKLQTLEHQDNKYKGEGETYSAAEVQSSVLCLKSVNRESQLNPLFEAIYDKCYFIGLMRNGYALCESWTRRGETAKKTGKVYRKFGEQLLADAGRFKRHKIVRFEDALQDPFRTASELFRYVELEQVELPALRLKSKKIHSAAGQRSAAFGDEHRKYWFTSDTINTILRPAISDTQSFLLSEQDRLIFERQALPILEHFGYR